MPSSAVPRPSSLGWRLQTLWNQRGRNKGSDLRPNPGLASEALRIDRELSREETTGCGGTEVGTELLTFALQTLPQEAPEQGPAVVAEGGHLVVVDTELVGHVDAEPLGAHLQGRQNTGSGPSSCAPGADRWAFCGTSFQRHGHRGWKARAWF